MSVPSAPKPIEELAFILGKLGWDTKFSDLSEDQVHVLIFGLQEAQKLSEEIHVAELEQKYVVATGTWPSTSIPF